ncbi:unnamed protein product [Staurois parvus]|uniref:Uncharacterized protein n=1 Tax=Staurois parvus TaxID=386267 RepID=A0ABN9FXS7_9NEOB|nr:unnamed protein product [Staurois parvus]
MLLPGPESLMGPCTASHCCCLHRHTLPCATFRSPHQMLVFQFFFQGWVPDYGGPLLAAKKPGPPIWALGPPKTPPHVKPGRAPQSSWFPVRAPQSCFSKPTLCHGHF